MQAKYLITDLFSKAPRGRWFTNEQLWDTITDKAPVSFKTVQNVTSGLKMFGGLRSAKFAGVTYYQRISKDLVTRASRFVF